MSDPDKPDLSACRHWRSSAALGPARVGIIPAWNAVTLLNPAAATIWDHLIETRDAGAAAAGYARDFPDRAQAARADVEACLDAWQRQGLFVPPAPSEETRLLQTLQQRSPAAGPVALRRTLSVAGIPTLLEVEDPTLAEVVTDLLVDFADAGSAPRRVLRASGPKRDGPQGSGPGAGPQRDRPRETWVLELDGRPVRAAPSLPVARGQIVAEIVRIAGGDAGWRATVHGAVLTGYSGPVFLTGASGAGKSTLAAGLVALGWQILAEDLAAFGDGWAVHPLPFALSIKEGAVDALAAAFPAVFPALAEARVHRLGRRRVRYQGLPAQARAQHPASPRLVLEVDYAAEMGAREAKLQRLSATETLGLFLNEESYIGFERDDTGDFLDFIARTPAYRIRYGSVAAAERGIRAALDRHPHAGPS